MDGKKKKVVFLVGMIFVFVIIFGVLFITRKPNQETIMDIVRYNGLKVNGSDSNIKDLGGNTLNEITIIFAEDKFEKFEIIDYGFDRIKRKYFCLINLSATNDTMATDAKIAVFLHYNNGWKLQDEIAIIDAYIYKYDEYKK